MITVISSINDSYDLEQNQGKEQGPRDLPAVQLAQKLHGLGGAIDRDGYHSTMEGAQGKRWSILKETTVFLNAFSKACTTFSLPLEHTMSN